MNICHIVGAGDFHQSLLKRNEGDLLIAADAGYAWLQQAKIEPDLYIGDSDSLGFHPQNTKGIFLPKVKDDTDMLAAVKEGLSRGYRRFYLYGALGGTRFSHSVANLQTLSFLAEQQAEGALLDEHCTVRLLLPGEHRLSFSPNQTYFSLFAWEGEAELSVFGANYPLNRATISPTFPLGVSNEAKGEVTVSVHKGKVLLVIDR